MANLKESIAAVIKIEKMKITANSNLSQEQKTEALGELEKVINGDFMTLSDMVQESVEEHKADAEPPQPDDDNNPDNAPL